MAFDINTVRVLGNLSLNGHLAMNQNLSEFPADPVPWSMVLKEGILYFYTNITPGSQFYTWLPISTKYANYVHTQAVASQRWIVTHNFGTEDFIYFVYDQNHNLVLANNEIIDANTAAVILNEATTGTAIFFSVYQASINVNGNSNNDNTNISTGIYDGGAAATVYLITENNDAGSAATVYLTTETMDGGIAAGSNLTYLITNTIDCGVA